MKGLFYEKKTRLGSMPPGCHNRCGECKPCIAVKEPMVPAHGPDDPGYGNAVPVEVSSWSSIAKSYDYKPLGWKFIQENFHVHSIRNNIDELTAALYLQVSLVSQALIFVTRSRSWSFIERPGLMLLSAFLVAQLVATLIAVYANWEFARIQGIGWGWAGVIWLYSIVFYIPLDVLKFMIRYALSGKAWDHMLQNKYIHAKDGAIQRSYVLFPNLKQLYIVSTLMTRDNLPCLISFSQNCPLLEELYIDVAISLLRVLLFVARPRTCALGNIPDSMIYRSVDQYPATHHIPGILILQIEAPIYFANSNYLRERISRWINEEEDQLKSSGETSLQYLILDMSAVGSIDTSGISMLEEVMKILERRAIKLILANPRSDVMKKLDRSKFIELLGQEWIFLTIGKAVEACNFMLHSYKPASAMAETDARDNIV